MAFKKIITSEGQPVVIRTASDDLKYAPGFSYRIGSMIYTVKKDVTQEATSSMREVGLSDGATEIMTVESITRDIKEPGCEVLPVDERFVKRIFVETVKKVAEKKVVKKKTKKKVAKKKKAKKNDWYYIRNYA